MVLLYLRGLLKPDYPQGLRSVAREELLLQAVAMEKTAAAQMSELTIQAAFASMFSPSKVTGMMKSMTESVRRIGNMSSLNTKVDRTMQRARGSVDSMIKLYQALVKQGIIVENNSDV